MAEPEKTIKHHLALLARCSLRQELGLVGQGDRQKEWQDALNAAVEGIATAMRKTAVDVTSDELQPIFAVCLENPLAGVDRVFNQALRGKRALRDDDKYCDWRRRVTDDELKSDALAAVTVSEKKDEALAVRIASDNLLV